ncbi:probable beta-galactosidase [Phialocephala subalpina]|uniref:Probable beta-galactosidase n=1 Tax=Phialocephala subalpina TaxID=576137 RepID=A0A1L7XJ53_9HELO|nr:probable beta-galactosidase [Phialocephala subalpina]
MSSEIPHLPKTETSQQLIVDGKPFLMLGGELQNSSMTSAAFMETVWAWLVDTNVNTVLGCVTWEQIEAVEGTFCFDELDKVIQGARRHGLRLVLLWFGSFKNGLSSYAPTWVKTNNKRFPRAKLCNAGGKLEMADVLSIFDSEAPMADSKAFAALMQHVKEVDEHHSTVIMVQVENEVGLLGDSRDRNQSANDHFTSAVPESLLKFLNENWDILHPKLRSHLHQFKAKIYSVSGSWVEVFGDNDFTDELFMAYHYALYVDSIASVGKSIFPVPMFINVWQNYSDEDSENPFPAIVGGGGKPGDYPSGGGVIGVLDIWQEFAKSLDFVAPDVYLNEYSSSCANYRHRNQPLFIPEQRRDDFGARRIWNAFGTHQALGTAPFGIDTIDVTSNPFKKHYRLLAQTTHHILAAQRRLGSMCGFFFDELLERGKDPTPLFSAAFGDWKLFIGRSFVFGKPSPGFGIVIHLDGAKFLLIGEGFQVKFQSLKETSAFTGILSFVEKEVVDIDTGELRTLRMLNGDETRSGSAAVMPSENPDYGDFPISITIPAGTGIAECEVYALEEA